MANDAFGAVAVTTREINVLGRVLGEGENGFFAQTICS
jgi:hypothetical protein